jgi:hypothetical protein
MKNLFAVIFALSFSLSSFCQEWEDQIGINIHQIISKYGDYTYCLEEVPTQYLEFSFRKNTQLESLTVLSDSEIHQAAIDQTDFEIWKEQVEKLLLKNIKKKNLKKFSRSCYHVEAAIDFIELKEEYIEVPVDFKVVLFFQK